MLRRVAPACCAALIACREPPPPTSDLVAPWIQLVGAASVRENIDAPVASRAHAYVSIALYEGYVAGNRSGLRSLAGQVNGLWHVPTGERSVTLDAATVAAEAARVVVDSLYASPATKSAVDSLGEAQMSARRAAGVAGATSDRSRDHGSALAREILAWAASDGFFATRNRPWRAPAAVGKWMIPRDTARASGPHVILAGAPTGTGDTNGAPRALPRKEAPRPSEPYWGRLRNYALRYGEECEPPRLPEYSDRRGSEFWKMGQELRDSLAVLTPEKRAIAAFWADSNATSLVTHWTGIVASATSSRALDAGAAAEMYMLSSIAMADAYIAAWKEKYRAMVVRPAAYLQRTGELPVDTSMSPEYPSAHAVVSGAMASVLARVVGDSVPLSHHGRMFRNFSHVRDDAAIAGVYAGSQFVPAVVNGAAQGACIGARVFGRLKTRP